jgi:hypothetical protein
LINSRPLRRLAALFLLASLTPASLLAAPTRGAAAQALDASLRYTSATYGYSLLIPPGWVRVPHVRWTPRGPAADLTVMPPDHQAALGVFVVPTGSATYSATDLQNLALRLISQQSPLPTVATLEGYARISQEVIKKLVANHTTYQSVTADLTYGGHMVCYARMSVAVAQQHRRLYVVAALVYESIAGLPPGGSGSTDTPTPGGFAVAPGSAHPAAMATAVAGPMMAHDHHAASERPSDAPAPLPTDRERGNLCRTQDDAGLVFLDKNCAATRYSNAMLQAFSSINIAARAAADPRPAPVIGADGFATYASPAQGVTVHYPAQWTPVSVPGALGAVQSPDQTALVLLVVQPTNAALSEADLQSIADRQIAQVGSVVLQPVHKTITMNGVPAVIALASSVGINTGSMVGSAQVSVLVTAYHHRLYLTRAATLLVHSGIGDQIPVIYPYFSPFTALARRAVFDFEPVTGALFTHNYDLGLAFDTALSMTVDPHVPNAVANGGTGGQSFVPLPR